jgi:hypothetical protein
MEPGTTIQEFREQSLQERNTESSDKRIDVMENTSQPKELISVRTRGKALVAIGLFLMVAMGIVSVISMWAMFDDATTLTSREKVFSVALFIVVILFGLNALLTGRSLIKRGAISKWAYIAGATLLGLFFSVANNTFSTEQPEERWNFARIAEEINQHEGLPRIEGETRMERVVAAGKMLTFTYTLVHLTSADADHDTVARTLPDFEKQECGTSLVKEALNRGGSIHYRWVGKDGGTITELLLMKGTCAGD